MPLQTLSATKLPQVSTEVCYPVIDGTSSALSLCSCADGRDVRHRLSPAAERRFAPHNSINIQITQQPERCKLITKKGNYVSNKQTSVCRLSIVAHNQIEPHANWIIVGCERVIKHFKCRSLFLAMAQSTCNQYQCKQAEIVICVTR